MRMLPLRCLTLVGAIAFGPAAMGQGTVRVTNTVRAGAMTYTATEFVRGIGLPNKSDVVIVGKVVEIEPDAIEVAPFRGAPKERMLKYKVANVQIEDRVLGAGGITRIRVGFLADGPGTGGFSGTHVAATDGFRPSGTVALSSGGEGCFSLSKHPNADFYVLVGPPTYKKDPSFAKEVDKLKKYARAINDPVAALKAKDVKDRFEAAQLILQRYLIPQGSSKREPIPEEENKLILALLAELPWVPADGRRVGPDGKLIPHRSALWYSINPNELGFKPPARPKQQPGDPPPNFDKLMDEATSTFLKENADKIRIKRFVQK